MKKKFALSIVAIAFSVLFFACEDEGIPIPLPPPLPTAQADDSLFKDDAANKKKTTAKGKEKAAPAAKKEVAKKDAKPAPAPKQTAKSNPIQCTVPCDTDSEQLSSGRYTIQIGVFPGESSARSLVRRMSDNGIRAYYAQVDNPAQLTGSFYRVRVGFFNGRAEAEGFAKSRLEPIGYAWWVDKRKNDKIGGSGGGNNYNNYTFTPFKPDNELETARQSYRDQLAREQTQAASVQQQGASSGKRKKVTRNKSSDDDFDWDD
ncbi:MAG: SPOR domain-containing protein [Fibromonadaceae bacterium]|jgi:hypothetical protein|nr:SPOR domain-containing protein [Fibromonadaceae bacterium]